MIYACCSPRRLEAVRAAGLRNGIEYVEVYDSEAPASDPDLQAARQRTLFLRLLRPPPTGSDALDRDNVSITGGERIPTVEVSWVAPAGSLPPGEDPQIVTGLDDPGTVLVVRTVERGDFSTYTLRLVASATDAEAPTDFDPLLVEVDFSFKVECPTDFDCRVDDTCPPEPVDVPAIDYLAKDYDTFRRLMLDRLSLTTPGWDERNPADAGMALVEVLAYLADELSYRQDAVATEAYLATARRRPSLRRLARLVDYTVHEGSNSRVWVQLQVVGNDVAAPADLSVITRVRGLPEPGPGPLLTPLDPLGADLGTALDAGALVFEPVDRTTIPLLHESLNTIDLYTWGEVDCCLPRGSTTATLAGHHADRLLPGHVLVLAEQTTRQIEDGDGNDEEVVEIDPRHRVAVRLTAVTDDSDLSGGLFDDPPTNGLREVTTVEWHPEDALAEPICVSEKPGPGARRARAHGNIVLFDHGRSVGPEALAPTAEPVLAYAATESLVHCAADRGLDDDASTTPVPVRYRPMLSEGPLTHARAAPHPVPDRFGLPVWPSAVATMRTDPQRATPEVTLSSETDAVERQWTPRRDLLSADVDDAVFVVEAEHDGTVRLRFGDDVHGRRAEPGSTFEASYRVGNGTVGNIGRDTVSHIVTASVPGISGVWNPLAGVGGVDPESAEVIRRDAPEAFLVQQRAVTAADYAEVTERDDRVQRAAATFRWTGSWRTVFVTADPVGGGGVDAGFETDLRRHIEPFRMAGYDLEVDSPDFVALEIEVHVCVLADYFRSEVRAAVLDVLGSGYRRDGSPAFFHPDNFTFAQPVYLSPIVAAAQAVTGVESVSVSRFGRQRGDVVGPIDTGILAMGRLEIARLDNNPNFPERGVLTITAGGGK